MVLRLDKNVSIDNLRHYPVEIVNLLRALLAAGAKAHPDPHRKNFFDVENGSRVYYIHLSTTGKVWLLATRLRDSQRMPAETPTLATA